jgi:radical SAM protein with 4Fe4S-binding SPASM domain
MPTNGTYIRRGNIEKLARNLPDVLHFSIDGATKESYEYVRVLGDFEEIVEHYRKLLDRRSHGKTRPGTKIAIMCALQKANLHDYRDMYWLVQSMPGLDSFDLVPVFDYDPEGGKFADLIPSPAEVTDLHRNLDQAIAAAPKEDERAFYRRWKEISGHWLKEAPEPAVSSAYQAVNSHWCMVPWFSAYVDAKGRVYPCCFLTNTEHVMGNIYRSSFADVWHGENYRKFRSHLIHDRKNLHGCATCPRNDDRRLAQLSKLRLVLRDAEPKQPVQPISAPAE